jgi:hypothetical protein
VKKLIKSKEKNEILGMIEVYRAAKRRLKAGKEQIGGVRRDYERRRSEIREKKDK